MKARTQNKKQIKRQKNKNRIGKNQKILYIGRCGYRYGTVVGGEISKSRTIYQYLVSKDYKIRLVDMYRERNTKALKLILPLLQILRSAVKSDVIIVVSCYPKIQKILHILGLDNRIIYVSIGSRADGVIRNSGVKREVWNTYRKIYVESMQLEKSIKALGISNAEFMRNCKFLPVYEYPPEHDEQVLKLLYLGQIRKEKGINCLIKAVELLNADKKKFELHLYGDVWENINIQEKVNDYIIYDGVIDLLASPDNYAKLRNYDIFVFPTEWEGESLSGAVQDALALGMPVVATNHHMNGEMVNDNVNGYLFSKGKYEELAEILMRFYGNRNLIRTMGKASLARADEFRAENVLCKLNSAIRGS